MKQINQELQIPWNLPSIFLMSTVEPVFGGTPHLCHLRKLVQVDKKQVNRLQMGHDPWLTVELSESKRDFAHGGVQKLKSTPKSSLNQTIVYHM